MRIERFQGEYPPSSAYAIYNVTPAEYWGEAPKPKKDTYTYFWTTQGPPPPITEDERLGIWDEVIQCIYRYLKRVRYRQADDFGRPVWGPTEKECEDFMANHYGHRTFVFHSSFNDERMLTAELVESLQREVLHNFRLWRILVIDIEDGESLIIYPEAVRAGTLPAALPQQEALARWLPGYYEREERKAVPVRRQFRWAYRRALAALPTFKEKKLQVVEVFDRYIDDTECYALWILHTQPWYGLRIDGSTSCAGHFPLGSNGEIGPDQWLAEKDDIPYWLTSATGQKDKSTNLKITHGGAEYDFTINPAEVIDDATLRQWDEQQHPPS